jgi:hypothetical protein
VSSRDHSRWNARAALRLLVLAVLVIPLTLTPHQLTVASSSRTVATGHHQLPTNPHAPVFVAALAGTALNGPGGSVSIQAGGTVRVTGVDRSDRLVKIHLSPSFVLYLLREFETMKFFSLPPEITGTGNIADAPTQTLTVATRHKTYEVTELPTLTPAPEAHVFNFLSRLIAFAAGLQVNGP